MHWSIASKCCDDWKFSPQTQSTDNKGDTKKKRTEKPSLAAQKQSCFDIRDLQKCYSAIFTATVNYSISPCFRQLWFFSKQQQKHFCSNSHSAVNWNSYKCCSATSCCCRRSHMTIAVIEHENAFVKRRCFFFCYFLSEKTETNMERLKHLWGCIWGIWALVRTGVKQLMCFGVFFPHKVHFLQVPEHKPMKWWEWEDWNPGNNCTMRPFLPARVHATSS